MKVTVCYGARFEYEEKASFSPHRVRLFPRHNLFITVDQMAFSSDRSAKISYQRDLFDNAMATCVFPELLEDLVFELKFDAELKPWDPFDFLLDSHAVELPMKYLPEEAAMLAGFRAAEGELGSLPPALSKSSPRPTVEALVDINNWLHENLEYERREMGDPWPAGETLKKQKGSCRDFAVLLAEVLRTHGLASRLVSGYLWEDASAAGLEHAENAFHAWVETYLPGAGWVGLDPTNGIFCEHHFLATAVGVRPADISPIEGHYYGKKTIPSTLTTELSIIRQ